MALALFSRVSRAKCSRTCSSCFLLCHACHLALYSLGAAWQGCYAKGARSHCRSRQKPDEQGSRAGAGLLPRIGLISYNNPDEALASMRASGVYAVFLIPAG